MPVVDESRWRFVLTDMNGATNTGGGQIQNAQQKQFADNLNAAKTAQVTMDITNPLADFAMNHDCLIKVYRKDRLLNWHLLMVGDMISAEEDGTGGDTEGTITLQAADPWWRLQRRFLGTGVNANGSGQGFTIGTNAAPVDAGVVAQQILQTIINLYPIGFTIIHLETIGTNYYLGPIYITNAGDSLLQVCNITGGPEVEFVPQEPSGIMPNTQFAGAYIRVKQGSTRPNAVFEYGVGKHNIMTYSRVITKDGLCNIAYSPPQGFPSAPAAGDTMIWSQDTTSQNARGMYQDIVQSDVASIPLRQELCAEYITVRTAGRQQIQFQPRINCDLDYTVDYGVGDVVVARAYVNGEYRLNGSARMYGVAFAIDDMDNETITLTLIPGTS